MLPLPKRDNVVRAVPPVGGAHPANAGLVWDKFVDRWSVKTEENKDVFGLHKDASPEKKSEKSNWVAKFCAGKLGDAARLTAHCRRLSDLALFTAKSALGAEPAEHPRTLTTTSRFVTGLGLAHPVDNGFAWHHTLGVPYLPGSGVKGMMRAFADHWQMASDDGDQNKKLVRRLFGNDQNEAAEMGALIVFDALPVEPVRLVHEVVTPHDGGWRLNGPVINEKTGIILSPGDWHDPNPVPFLAVEIGAQFQFALGLTRHGEAKDLELGYKLLTGALEWIGAGAKTATGLGRFEDAGLLADRRAKQEAERGAREAEAAQRARDENVRQAAAEKLARDNWVPAAGQIVSRSGEPGRVYIITRLDKDGDPYIRLLEGRDDFPVDRPEITFIATSADELKR